MNCAGAFLRRWFRLAMPLLLQPELNRLPTSKLDCATARDNFVLAASIAAGRDLCGLFKVELRWPIGLSLMPKEEGGDLVAELVGLAEAAAPWPRAEMPPL